MKFTNGYWLDRDGFSVLRAVEVRDVVADPEAGFGHAQHFLLLCRIIVYQIGGWRAKFTYRSKILRRPIGPSAPIAPAETLCAVALRRHQAGSRFSCST